MHPILHQAFNRGSMAATQASTCLARSGPKKRIATLRPIHRLLLADFKTLRSHLSTHRMRNKAQIPTSTNHSST